MKNVFKGAIIGAIIEVLFYNILFPGFNLPLFNFNLIIFMLLGAVIGLTYHFCIRKIKYSVAYAFFAWFFLTCYYGYLIIASGDGLAGIIVIPLTPMIGLTLGSIAGFIVLAFSNRKNKTYVQK